MNRRLVLAALLMLVALAGCAPFGAAPGQGPSQSYQRNNNDMRGGGDDGGGSGM